MSRKSPKPPKEDDSVIAARERQILDLAKLDEEENRRIKQMRTVSRGVRAFRATRGSARGSTRSGTVGAADSGRFTGYPGGQDVPGTSDPSQYALLT